ncbi:MAG: hypothetical protein FWC96_08285 [Oscillospiraceae bacterium]|nr:hypothetical protein [Oscillospiraceae bacterium]
MKRLFAVLIILVLTIGALVGCGGAAVDLDGHPLVGEWAWSYNIAWRYVLNSDGTGTRGGGGMPVESFTWGVRGDNEARITVGRGGAVERWTFTLLGNNLTLARSATNENYEYMRVGAPPSGHTLTGTWSWTGDDSYQYILNADGSGTRGVPGAIESFTWLLDEGNHLLLDLGWGVIESWTFGVTGDTLTLSSRQVSGMVYSYTRS